MALQLRNKVDKEKKDTSLNKNGKYKRKRNVFGKRLTRFGLIGTIVALLVIFAVVKTIFTLQQNKKQKKIDSDLASVNAMIKQYRRDLNGNTDSYENVGELIATLPTSFDQQATSLDLDRIIILSGLTESTTSTRKISEASAMPFECSITTVKAVQITMTLYGEVGEYQKVLKLMDYLTDYDHENFYYVANVNYTEDRMIYKRSVTNITIFTFYNDIVLTPADTTNTTTV